MYKKYRRKTVLLYICGTVAIGACAALIAFTVWILALRTEYKKACLEINDKMLASSEDQCFVVKEGKKYPLSMDAKNYYDQVLLEKKAVVYNRKPCEPDEKSIVLQLSDCTLSFTGMEDGTAFNLRWETPDKTRYYSVRSTNYTFTNLNSYLKNYLRKTEAVE